MEQEKNILIAKRVPPGDRFVLVDDEKQTVYNSLTETLEAYFKKSGVGCDFRLSPLKGELHMISTEEITPEPPKKFNIYGDY